MDVILKVPVRRFVLKYIETKFGPFNNADKAWHPTKWFKEGRVLISLLERTPHRYEKYKKNEAVLNICVPTKLVNTRGCYITQESIDDFIAYVQDLILDEVETYQDDINNSVGIKNCQKVNICMGDEAVKLRKVSTTEGVKFFSQKEIILDKLEKYRLTEDDLTYDSVVKQLQRRAKRKRSA